MNQNKNLIIASVTASIFFVIILYLLYLLNLKNTQSVIPHPVNKVTGNIVLPSITPTDTLSNWKTYKNEKFGYEFKYPQNWEINRIIGSPPKLTDAQLAQTQYLSLYNPSVVTGTDNGDQIQFFPEWGHPDPNSSQIQIIPIYCDNNSISATCLKKIFGDKIPVYTHDASSVYPSIRVESVGPENTLNIEVYVLYNNHILYSKVSITNPKRKDTSLAVFNQILSTFKFANDNSIPQPISDLFDKINKKFSINLTPTPEDTFYSPAGTITKSSWKIDLLGTKLGKNFTSFLRQELTPNDSKSGGIGGGGIDAYETNVFECYHTYMSDISTNKITTNSLTCALK